MTTQNNNHIDEQTLKKYVAGQLSSAAADGVLAHLEHCDICLEQVEQLWAQDKVGPAKAEKSLLTAVSPKHRERRLINRIHRSNMSGKLVEIGFSGFFDVVLALLRPLTGTPPKRKARGEGYD
ncbi:MAG: hypothetical protein KC423_15165 [Anaerolineales bacterium]|nr:hypothetical protein [Anaerolineales bacterium]MCB9434522.1 hypothetical protein [Ardenticatenaceae bacterium]